MTNQNSFEEYWAKRVESLNEVGTLPGLMDIRKNEAKKAWSAGCQCQQVTTNKRK